jgi:hypothetical protein
MERDQGMSTPTEVGRRASFEARARRLLVGLRPMAVRYIEIDYDASGPMFGKEPEFDSLDFGLELVGEDGRVVGLEWSDDSVRSASRC